MAKKIAWTDQATADMRAIDQQTALRTLHGLARFIATEQGDVKRLQDIDPPEFRLRAGDYRVRFAIAGRRSRFSPSSIAAKRIVEAGHFLAFEGRTLMTMLRRIESLPTHLILGGWYQYFTILQVD